ncbi:TPR domain protein [Citrifermentans bemidjiense Bem]|uniref:TPR domain protein n=1 Tax=Citrifermentans bemidjiense (strain ATCC BAA-1014 / DSM 16622 / JCM 12645 / Bem) TaxID=404380 RepID=B5EH32_CITBB|nr:tetratricopeptide repeat protein [Citrifermentans bemidjiense]ACH38134.1 TPR domain protein [Citrifermentans bemidjiense Bem]
MLKNDANKKILLAFILVVVTLAVFAKTAGNDFINFDDPGYVTKNPVVQQGLSAAGISWAFTATAMSNWHPLTWLSHMLDVQLFGLHPAGHHLMNVVIHAAAALLLFLFLVRTVGGVWLGFSVAALFALHPLHVESVAWVAERKDVLSCLLMLVSLHFWVSYVKRPGPRPYLGALLAFVAGLMAKPMLVTLPVVLLLLDYWPFRRLFSEVDAGGAGVGSARATPLFVLMKEKIPFFLFSALSSIITIYGQQHGGAMATLAKAPIYLRVENSLVAYAKYLGLMLWPRGLAILYPFPQSVPLWQPAAAVLILAVLTAAVFILRRRYPYLVTGWLWYLVTLLPVIGLIQVGGQSTADRYTYIPLIGIFLAICCLVADLTKGWHAQRTFLFAVGAVSLTALTTVTIRQLDYWKDSIAICRHALAVTHDNYLITNNYGIALDARGDLAGAYRQFQETLRINPRSTIAYSNLGALSIRWGQYENGLMYYDKALGITPNSAVALEGMGKALAGLGRGEEAITKFRQALAVDPRLPEVHLALATELTKAGRPEEALEHEEAARQLEPLSPQTAINLGVALAKQGRLAEALDSFTRAVAIDPASVEAHFNRGVALAGLGRPDEAALEFNRVLAIRPDTVAARNWLEKIGRK